MIRVLIILCVTFAVRAVLPCRVRDYLMPWAFAFAVWWNACTTFFGSFGAHYMGVSIYTLCLGIVLYGFRDVYYGPRHNAFKLFTCTAIYYSICCFWGRYGVETFINCLEWYLEAVGIGYFAGIWMARDEDRVRRILTCCVLICIPTAYFYGRMNALDVPLEDAGRLSIEIEGGLAEDIGPNATGMLMSAMLFYPLIYIVNFAFSGKRVCDRFVRLLIVGGAIVSIGVFCIVIIKTGCRNAVLGAVPYVLYVVCGRWKGSGRISGVLKHVIIIALCCGAGIFVVKRFFYEGFDFRGFDFGRDNVEGREFGNGRIVIWEQFIAPMSPLQWIVGSGAAPDRMRSFYAYGPEMVAHAHNSYVQLFSQSGLIGCALFFSLMAYMVVKAKRHEVVCRQIIFVLLFVWFLLGMGESFGFISMIRVVKYHFGMALALCDMPFSSSNKRLFGYQQIVHL